MMGKPKRELVLSAYQQKFAEEHYGLLISFMRKHGLGDDEYGLFAERYLRTVVSYTENQDLQKRYAFSTVLWYRLWAELGREKTRQRKQRCRECYLEDRAIPPSSLDKTGVAELWQDICNDITKEQIHILELKAMGYTHREAAQMLSCSKSHIQKSISKVRKILRASGILR